MWAEIATVLALVLVFEGLLYALLPSQMKDFMLRLATHSSSVIRNVGLLAASAGVFVIWLIRG
ncbi:MAG: hypothetical protein CMM33_09090 [Rhodospirillaceae bacterium]|nr:hypothetical protein [Rhodospirillaceae bacterium]